MTVAAATGMTHPFPGHHVIVPSGCYHNEHEEKISQSNIIGQVASHSDPVRAFRVLNVGGNANSDWSNSVQYGLSYSNANNDLSNSNANIGARLTNIVDELTVIATLPIGRTSESTTAGSVACSAKTRINDKGDEPLRSRLKDCYRELCDTEILESAGRIVCRTCSNRNEAQEFQEDFKGNIEDIRTALVNHTFVHSDYKVYYKQEKGKTRRIADLPIRDKIVHCATAIVLEDRLNRTLIDQTYASIKGRGTHKALTDVRRHLHNDPRLCYVLVMDIDQFFATIDPERVKLMLRDYIKDKDMLSLLDGFLDNYTRSGYPGIALGGRLSPLFANLYLSEIDHYLKERLHVHVMVRYMDNYYIFGYSVEWLQRIRKETVSRLGDLGLGLNEDTRIQKVDSTHGVDMIGWVVFSDHIRIRKRTKENMRRTFRLADEKLDRCQELTSHDLGAIGAYVGCFKWFDGRNLC